jgi:hypothetical protein
VDLATDGMQRAVGWAGRCGGWDAGRDRCRGRRPAPIGPPTTQRLAPHQRCKSIAAGGNRLITDVSRATAHRPLRTDARNRKLRVRWRLHEGTRLAPSYVPYVKGMQDDLQAGGDRAAPGCLCRDRALSSLSSLSSVSSVRSGRLGDVLAAEDPAVNKASVRAMLGQLVDAGRRTKPGRGRYAVPTA